MRRMTSGSGDGRHRSIDRTAFDPALLAPHRDPNRWATRRIVLVAVGLVVLLALSTMGIRATMARVQAARSAVPALQSLVVPPGLEGRAAAPEERRVTPEELAELQKSWIDSQSYAPRSDRVDAKTGERVGAFQGFGISVDTAPPGARVVVNGQEMGTSPLLTTADCAPGDEVRVVVERGRLRGSATTSCRKDVLVKLELPLR